MAARTEDPVGGAVFVPVFQAATTAKLRNMFSASDLRDNHTLDFFLIMINNLIRVEDEFFPD